MSQPNDNGLNLSLVNRISRVTRGENFFDTDQMSVCKHLTILCTALREHITDKHNMLKNMDSTLLHQRIQNTVNIQLIIIVLAGNLRMMSIVIYKR